MRKTSISNTTPIPTPTPRPILASVDRPRDGLGTPEGVVVGDEVNVGLLPGFGIALVVGVAVMRAAGLIQVSVPELVSSEALYLI